MTSPTTPDRPLALVTGASTGIGAELAAGLAAQGHDLVVVADEPAIHETATRLREHGGTVEAVQVDLSVPDGVEQLYARVRTGGRPVDVAVLNAGIAHWGRFDQTDLAGDLRVVGLNVASTVHLAKLLLPGMVERGAGRLLLTSSIAATMPGPYYATYAASKAFVHSFAEALRDELRGTGVTVTSLMPGPTRTEFFQRSGMSDTVIASGPKDSAAKVAAQGLAAMMAGRAHVVAGNPLNRVQALTATLLPDVLSTRMHALLTHRLPGRG
jgi:uncharacterized protein